MDTWNIVFIGLDIHTEDNKPSLIEQTKERFLNTFENYCAQPDNPGVFNFICLNYVSKKPVGKATLSYNIPGTKELKNETTAVKNWYNRPSYKSVLKNIISQNKDFHKQKLLVVFVAHSFGAGFAPYMKNDKPKYLTAEDLNSIFVSCFGKKKVDCLIALSCSIQSVETNLILRNTVKYIIGSQIEIYPDTIDFKFLLWAIRYRKAFGDELMWSRLLYDWFTEYTKKQQARKKMAVRLFNISLSKPGNLAAIIPLLNKIGPRLQQADEKGVNNPSPDNPTIGNVVHYMDDSSTTGQGYTFDCKQFFLMMESKYRSQKNIQEICLEIFNCIHNGIIASLSSPNSHLTDLKDREDGVKFFVPNGISIYFPLKNGVSSNLKKDILSDSLTVQKTTGVQSGKSLARWYKLIDYYLKK